MVLNGILAIFLYSELIVAFKVVSNNKIITY